MKYTVVLGAVLVLLVLYYGDATSSSESISLVQSQVPFAVPPSVPEPSFPIITSAFGTDPLQPAYRVKYISADGNITTSCLKGAMASTIPESYILPSSMRADGNFANMCPAQESAEYKPWPF